MRFRSCPSYGRCRAVITDSGSQTDSTFNVHQQRVGRSRRSNFGRRLAARSVYRRGGASVDGRRPVSTRSPHHAAAAGSQLVVEGLTEVGVGAGQRASRGRRDAHRVARRRRPRVDDRARPGRRQEAAWRDGSRRGRELTEQAIRSVP